MTEEWHINKYLSDVEVNEDRSWGVYTTKNTISQVGANVKDVQNKPVATKPVQWTHGTCLYETWMKPSVTD